MPVGIQNAAATSEKTKDPGLHKGNTVSQTLDYSLLPKGVDSYDNEANVVLKKVWSWDFLNSKLSLERYWQGPRPLEVGEAIPNATLSSPERLLH